MKPLIPGSEPQASELASVLRQAGHAPEVLSFLTIGPGNQLAEFLPGSQDADLMIAVSPHAIAQLDLWLQQRQLGWPAIPALAIGMTTANRWKNCGVRARYPVNACSEGLLSEPELANVQGLRILILRGNGGRELLAEELQRRGAKIRYCECYRRHWLPLDGQTLLQHWRTAGIDSVIISSGELLQRLLTLIPESGRTWLHTLTFIVPSHRIADLVVQAGLPMPMVAQGATPAAMEAALGKRNLA